MQTVHLARPDQRPIEAEKARLRFELFAVTRGSIADADETRVGLLARKARCCLQERSMVLHRIEPGDAADDKGGFRDTPGTALQAARGGVGMHHLRIDAVRNDRDPASRHSAFDRIGANRMAVGDDEVGALRQPHFERVGQRGEAVIALDFHGRRAHAIHEPCFPCARQEQGREHRLRRVEGIDDIGAFRP